MRLRVPASLLAVVLSTVAVGCGSATPETSAQSGQQTSSSAAPSTPAPSSSAASPSDAPSTSASPSKKSAPPAPAVPEKLKFSAKTLDGKSFAGASLAGKPVALWFWAPWCPKCRGEANDAAEVASKYAGKVNLVGIAGKAGKAEMQDFVKQYKLSGFPHIVGDDLWTRFEVPYQSTWVLLDRNGKPVHNGELKGDSLFDEFEKLAAT